MISLSEIVRLWFYLLIPSIFSLSYPSPTSKNTANAVTPENLFPNVENFDSIVTDRLANFASAWPDLSIVSVAINSDEKDLTHDDSNSIFIRAWSQRITSYLDIETRRGDPLPVWRPTHTWRPPSSLTPRHTWSWDQRSTIPLSRAYDLLGSQYHLDGPWFSAVLEPTDEAKPAIPGRLIYRFERQGRLFPPRPSVVRLNAVTGERIYAAGLGDEDGDESGDGDGGGGKRGRLADRPVNNATEKQ